MNDLGKAILLIAFGVFIAWIAPYVWSIVVVTRWAVVDTIDAFRDARLKPGLSRWRWIPALWQVFWKAWCFNATCPGVRVK